MKRVCKVILFSVLLVVVSAVSIVMAQEKSDGEKSAIKKDPSLPSPPKRVIENFRFKGSFKPKSPRILRPEEDGIHDPDNEGTFSLQPPQAGFKWLPKAADGNLVDWVKALNKGAIEPWWSKENPKGEVDLLELDIVMMVKGSMQDVLFPHDAHSQWLACENCHDEIFIPEVDANRISMVRMLLGEQCGVCHGKVAFPMARCKGCHSVKKDSSKE